MNHFFHRKKTGLPDPAVAKPNILYSVADCYCSHLRSNNSWMHNIKVLVKGKPRCTLHIHPDDAARLGVVDGSPVRVTSRVGSVVAQAEITDAIRPRVVSLPHGWGHSMRGTRMTVAQEHAGVNSNVLTDHEAIDPLSGNAVLNGIPVELERGDSRTPDVANSRDSRVAVS